jgi:hypothetical protein
VRLFLVPLFSLVLAAVCLRTLRRERPPMEWRVAAGILGSILGWLMASWSYIPDPAHRYLGFPFPVCIWQRTGEAWVDHSGSWGLPCFLADILAGWLLAGWLLSLARRASRGRTGFSEGEGALERRAR